MDQTKVNIAANGSPKDDGGGELDPHGADLVCLIHFDCALVTVNYRAHFPLIAWQPPRVTRLQQRFPKQRW